MSPVVLGYIVGAVVTVLTFAGMILNTWTVMHSGWSLDAVQNYYRLTYVVPPVAGTAIGWLAYRLNRSSDAD